MKRMALVLALLGVVALADKLLAGWGSGGCGPVGPTVPNPTIVVPERTGWEKHEGKFYFYSRGEQIAGWDPAGQVYRAYDAATHTWGPAVAAPWAPKTAGVAIGQSPPCTCPDPKGCATSCQPCGPGCECTCKNFGLVRDKMLLAGQPECYTISDGQNVHQTTRQEAFQAMAGASGLTDDSGLLRLTVIGPDELRKQVLTDWDSTPALAPWKDRTLVQGYPSDHWAVAAAGFVTTGKPTICVQTPDGKVLHRQDDYEGGATALAEAIRKADPNYKADQDKDKRKPDPTEPIMAFLKHPYTILAALVAGILLLLRKGSTS